MISEYSDQDFLAPFAFVCFFPECDQKAKLFVQGREMMILFEGRVILEMDEKGKFLFPLSHIQGLFQFDHTLGTKMKQYGTQNCFLSEREQ